MADQLTEERWERLQSLFHAAVDKPRSEWRAFLDTESGGDTALADRVMGMLVADERSGSVLDRDTVELAGDLFQGTSGAIGRRVGPYRIVQLLGEGGSGVVYLAERDDLGSMAAVKVLRDAWVSPSRRERFASEQRLLAQLNHPAIARLFDAGTLEDGTPWIVMEHVEGAPITEASRSLGLRDRLRLFRSACEAVVHAHQHLVVHRDVKPSNILVTTDGSVKLLDFGIAKQLEAVEADRTQTGLRMMTPAYAAPEQVLGNTVGVYTDVYALGVVLYELLAGTLPHAGSATSGEYERRILEVDPPPASQLARGGTGVSATRREWHDLDVLCATAMRKEPARRYASVDALIRDVDHFLDGTPLDAQPDTFGYRASRFISRNRTLVTAATVVVVAITALSVFYTVRLTRARDLALAEAARTGRIQRFVTQLFEGGDASAGPAESLHVVTLVDRGVQEARSLTTDPKIQAELFQTLGGIYQKLGNYQRADTLLRDALARRSALFGDSSVDAAASLIALGLLRTEEANYAEAESLSRSGLAISTARLPEGHPQRAEATELLGRILSEKSDYKAAIGILEDAVRQRALRDTSSAEYASSLYELANAHFYAGHYDASDSLNRIVLALHKQLYGARHPTVSDDLINLGASQFERGNYEEAERLYRQALEITAAYFGKDHHRTAANMTMIGRTLVMQKRFDEAKEILTRALAVRERVYGPVHPAVASTINEIASIAYQVDRYDDAVVGYERVVAIYRTIHGDNHYMVGIGLANLASVHMARRENREAELLFRQALAIYDKTLPPTNTNVGISRIKLGRVLLREGRFAEAEANTRAGYDLLAPQMNPTVSWLVAARTDLATVYDSLGRKADAARIRATADSLTRVSNATK